MCCQENDPGGVGAHAGADRGEAWGPTKVLTPPSSVWYTTKPLPRKQACGSGMSGMQICPTCGDLDLAPAHTNRVRSVRSPDGNRCYRRERCERCGRDALTVYHLTPHGTWHAVRGTAARRGQT